MRFLPRDAMHKRGVRRRAVSVTLSRSCIVSRRLRYSHHCYGMQIGITQAVEWYYFSMTLSDLSCRFQGHAITRRWNLNVSEMAKHKR